MGIDDVIDHALNASTLQFITHDLFMHYFDKQTKVDPKDPSWLNQGVYFWRYDERFEKKSLPIEFKTFSKYTFYIKYIPEIFRISKSSVIPWFGMEGNGERFAFTKDDQFIALSHLFEVGVLQYFKFVSLDKENLSILQERAHYVFHFSPHVLTYKSGVFYYNEEQISVSAAYKRNLLTILQISPKKNRT